VALLLHDDDLHPESLPIDTGIAGAACLALPPAGDPGSHAARFAAGALDDAAVRVRDHFSLQENTPILPADSVPDWADALGVKTVVTPYAPAGLTCWALDAVAKDLAAKGIALITLQRAFDARAWPHAKAGFFKLKEAIPRLIAGNDAS
jgi:deoxyribodipyrimidine photo-lyase